MSPTHTDAFTKSQPQYHTHVCGSDLVCAPISYVHTCMSHVTHTHESCHATHMNVSSHTYERVMSCISVRMSPPAKKSGPHITSKSHMCTHEWVISHIWVFHAPHIDESWHTYERATPHTHIRAHKKIATTMSHTHMAHSHVCYDSFFFLGWWLAHTWDVTHSCVDLDVVRAPMCVRWLFHMCDMAYSCVWRDSFMCVTWLIYMCDMTHPYVWHVWFIYMWFGFGVCTHVCGMTHSYEWHDTFIRVTWHIHRCDMTHSYVWHASFICDLGLVCANMCVTWLMYICDMAHACDMHHLHVV